MLLAALLSHQSGCAPRALPLVPQGAIVRPMSVLAPAKARVLIYVFASAYLLDDAIEKLRADLADMCRREDLQLIQIVIDRGPPKRSPTHYPVLDRILRGQADGVLVVRSALYQRGRPADRLERLCPKGPAGWLTVADLQAGGLLPKPRKPVFKRRPSLLRRTAKLRDQGLNLRQLGQTLAAEGYQRPDGLPWSAESVAKLLGIFVLPGGMGSEEAKPAPRA